MIIAFIGIIIGIAVAMIFPFEMPSWVSEYISIMVLVGVNQIAYSIRELMSEEFKIEKFIFDIIFNGILVGFMVYLGEVLNAFLIQAIYFVYVIKIFENFSKIRELFLQNSEKKVKIEEVEISHFSFDDLSDLDRKYKEDKEDK